MVTIFAIPKAFVGHFNVIQKNAITSWTLLDPKPEIILFGNDDGVAEISQDLGLVHVPDIQVNELGTPMLNDAFARARTLTENPLLCYVNADIILTNDFMQAAQSAMKWSTRFLIVGRRWDLDVDEKLGFDTGWQMDLSRRVSENGWLHEAYGIDYFLFPRELFTDHTFPSFAVGRVGWDNWFLYWARQQNIPLLDVTDAVQVIHQNHDYSHFKGGRGASRSGTEAQKNILLAGKYSAYFDINSATNKLTPFGIRTNWSGKLYLSVLKNMLVASWYKYLYGPVVIKTKPFRDRFGLSRSKAN